MLLNLIYKHSPLVHACRVCLVSKTYKIQSFFMQKFRFSAHVLKLQYLSKIIEIYKGTRGTRAPAMGSYYAMPPLLRFLIKYCILLKSKALK